MGAGPGSSGLHQLSLGLVGLTGSRWRWRYFPSVFQSPAGVLQLCKWPVFRLPLFYHTSLSMPVKISALWCEPFKWPLSVSPLSVHLYVQDPEPSDIHTSLQDMKQQYYPSLKSPQQSTFNLFPFVFWTLHFQVAMPLCRTWNISADCLCPGTWQFQRDPGLLWEWDDSADPIQQSGQGAWGGAGRFPEAQCWSGVPTGTSFATSSAGFWPLHAGERIQASAVCCIAHECNTEHNVMQHFCIIFNFSQKSLYCCTEFWSQHTDHLPCCFLSLTTRDIHNTV